ncbi:MAG: cytochrome P450 [Sphingomonadaceae bacterium]|nr:cytochrome P450 [Sphingomonadaceae bacterium]MCP5390841.1 cytochrome P450 [Sphingomonadaceae bacterium]MCP5394597.1 cytochrome P450 [Sphingomonadaceae bacterium]
MTSQRWVPSQPPRVPDWQSTWRGLTGKKLRNSVYNVPEPAFDEFYHRRTVLGRTYHLVHDPELIGEVLLHQHEAFRRPGIARKALSGLLGESLLLADGEEWRGQRKIVAPRFNPRSIDAMAAVMMEEAEHQIERLRGDGSEMDVMALATRTTTAVIARTLFASDKRLLTPVAFDHVQRLVAQAGQPRLLTLLGMSGLDLSPSARRARISAQFLRETIAAMADDRIGEGGADDFFGELLAAFLADRAPERARKLAIDNAITFYIAGHETVSTLLAWSAYCLAGQPELQEELRTEALAALGNPAEALARAVPQLQAFVDEVLRLYPPGVLIAREAASDVTVGNIAMSAGDIVTIYPWVVHRHRKLWDEPDAFVADRMAQHNKAKLPRFQFLPFGAGPRVCVGARFAIAEALTVLSVWLAHIRFRAPPGFAPMPSGTIALRPEGGMPLFVERLTA